MIKEILEGKSRKTQKLMADLKKSLDRAGIPYSLKSLIVHDILVINKDIRIGVASTFSDMYTVMDGSEEALNTPSVDKVMDYLYKEVK